ncbi:retrovirus-related Pol polyprotein from transposon 412 [Trichonephila clavipes]|nr:retrovirus-related Pol polyprotein from transposon 412 [Trichonephila clavipes]
MDESLRSVWGQAEDKQNAYDIDDEVLVHLESICGENVKQVVLPTCKREEVMRVAHEIPLAGHLGESKTKQRIKYSFFWPKLKQDVRSFCQSCKTCQLRRGLTYRDRIPITPIVRPENPFEVWSVDCIGPLEPSSRRGHTAAVAEWYRYWTVVCFVTGSSPVPQKTRRVGQRCTLNLSRAETSSRWCGVVVRRGGASSGVVHVT